MQNFPAKRGFEEGNPGGAWLVFVLVFAYYLLMVWSVFC